MVACPLMMFTCRGLVGKYIISALQFICMVDLYIRLSAYYNIYFFFMYCYYPEMPVLGKSLNSGSSNLFLGHVTGFFVQSR